MTAKTSLRDYQRQLSERLANPKGRESVSNLGLRAGGTSWLVDLADAGEVVPVPAMLPVPLTHAWFRGVANIRGTLHCVVDFAAFLGRDPVAVDQRARLLLIAERYRVNSALLVEGVLGLYREDDFVSVPDTAGRWSSGDSRDRQGNVWKRLDLTGLTAHPEFLHVGL